MDKYEKRWVPAWERIMSLYHNGEYDAAFYAAKDELGRLISDIIWNSYATFAPRLHEDMQQAAYMSLWMNLGRFDPTRGTSPDLFFARDLHGSIQKVIDTEFPWATRYYNEIITKLKKKRSNFAKRTGRQPTVEELAALFGVKVRTVLGWLELEEMMRTDEEEDQDGHAAVRIATLPAHDPDPLDLVCQKETMQQIEAALESLTPEEKDVIAARYGFGNNTLATWQEVAKMCGISRQKAIACHTKAITKLAGNPHLAEFKEGDAGASGAVSVGTSVGTAANAPAGDVSDTSTPQADTCMTYIKFAGGEVDKDGNIALKFTPFDPNEL